MTYEIKHHFFETDSISLRAFVNAQFDFFFTWLWFIVGFVSWKKMRLFVKDNEKREPKTRTREFLFKIVAWRSVYYMARLPREIIPY